MKKIIKMLALFVVAVSLTGCLSSEKKEYSYKVNGDGSGSGKIKFVNIISQKDDGKDVSFSDFGELVDKYLNGEQFETDNPNLVVTDKKLYEEDGKLMGEVTFTFKSLSDINFIIEPGCDCSPIFYPMSTFSETFESSNGTYLGENSSATMIKWPSGTKEFTFTTVVTSDLKETVSLLGMYKTWKESNK